MFEILNTILPVFLIMAIGYLAVRSGYLNHEISDNLNAVTVKLAVPVLLFRAIYHLDFEKAIHWQVLASFYSGAIISFLLAATLARGVFKRRPGEAVAVGFCAMFSNTVLLGIPIAERAFGTDILPLVFGVIAFHAPVLYVIGIISMEFARSDGRSARQTLATAMRSILANSLMIGIVLGAILNKLSVTLPTPIEVAVNMIASAAIPIALIGIGAALTRYEMKSEISETVMVSLMSLIVHPAIVFMISHYFLGLPTPFVQAAVIIAAMPPGMNIYIFALMYNRAIALSASSLIGATVASIFTISGWLWLLNQL